MSDDSGRRVYKVRGSGVGNSRPTAVSLVHTSTQSSGASVSPVVVQSQPGATLMHSAVMPPESLVHMQAEPEAQSQVHTQSQAQMQSQTHIQSQPQSLLQTHSQVLPLSQGDTQTLTQPQTQTNSLVQVTPRTLAQSLVYSHSQVLTQSQIHTHSQVQAQSQVHTQSHLHTQSQVNTPSQLHIQPQMHTQSQIQVQPLTLTQPHIQVQSQLTQLPLQSQLPSFTQSSMLSTMSNLVDATQEKMITVKEFVECVQQQMGNPSSQQSGENSTGMEVVQVPVTRQQQHNSPSVTLPDLHSSTASINEALSNNSQEQLMHSLTSFPQAEQLSTTIGMQPGNATLSQTLPQSLAQTQILDAYTVEGVLMPSRNSLVQASVPVSSIVSVEIDGMPAMHVQDDLTARPEDQSSLVISTKEISNSNSSVTTQVANSHITTSQLSTSPLESSQLSNLHITQENEANSLCKKPTSTISAVIASNSMLNKLLDTAKPHIPSQVTKAAEIAHLVPNPTVRMSTAPRLGDMDDGTEMIFPTTSRGSSPLTTSTRSSAASMCTVTGSLRGSNGYGDSLGKTSTPLNLDGIFGLPSNFQLNNTTLLLPSSVSHGQIIPQRQFETVQQVLLGPQSTANMVEQQLEGLNAESLRVLSTTQMAPITTCSVSGNNTLVGSSLVDKICRKTGPSLINQNVSNTKSFNILGMQEGMNKSGVVMDSLIRSQGNSSSKAGLITSTDPMFPSVVITSNCSSPTSLGSVISSRAASISQEGSNRVRGSMTDTRISPQTLVDIFSHGSNSDAVVGGNGIPLIGLSESRLPHTGDVLLSELHRSDESDLSLSASLTGTTSEELNSNPSGLVTEASLGPGIGGDTAPLHGLPSPPLSSFSLPNITADFMVGGVSGGKSCSSGQGPLPALLSNLATTADLDQFLESSNMCIDMSSLSESEVSLSTGSGAFSYSPEKSGTSKKLASSTSSDLTFTNALKAATTKSDNEQMKLCSDSGSPSRILNQDQKMPIETTKTLQVDVSRLNSSSMSQNSPDPHSHSSLSQETPVSSKKSNSSAQTKTTQPQSQSKKRKEMFRKNELLVQQVACFKCRLCSFLSQDKDEMVNHMKERHSQYLSDTDESEEEVEKSPLKKGKASVRKNDKNQHEESAANQEPDSSTKTRGGSPKCKDDPGCKTEIYVPETGKFKNCISKIEEEQSPGRIGIFIKTEPKDVGEFERKVIDKEDEEEDLGLTIELGETNEPGSYHNFYYEDNTNDSGSTRPNNKKTGRSVFSKTTGTAKFKKKNPSVMLSDEVLGIRCDVNGCGLRMKSENNIAYHRKCHVKNLLQCQECSSKFQSWRELALHLWRQHLIDMELHKCDKCDYKCYSYTKLMNVHHKIHSDERPSLCDTCGKCFKSAKQLRNHKALHMKKSPYQHQCEICLRPFSEKRMLHNHQESVHKKVKPFLCNYCGYSTASRSTLKMHMRQHTGEKPFACEKCKYCTSDHNSLRRHKMQHTGVRPYRCPYCDYASIQSTTFKVHLKDKHPALAQLDGIMFTCGMCSFKTVKRDNYLAHIAEHRRGENKKQCQVMSPTKVSKTEAPQAILSDMAPPAPHVVNIDVDSGAVTVESPVNTDFINNVNVQAPVPGQVILAGEQYIYAAVDSSMLSQGGQ
ncbi:uncharacterized protein [Cherax quadricarinatus]|uniref:uncharacterized protein isoform X3 n=1 Tax=Cherax quadricarinatus TaxID=27406 RepID=UPI00387E5F3F